MMNLHKVSLHLYLGVHHSWGSPVPEKTLITHATDDTAKFLGYEITVTRCGHLISENGSRATNGKITLLMPRKVVSKYRERYGRGGKIIHKPELMAESDYTIIQRFQSVLR